MSQQPIDFGAAIRVGSVREEYEQIRLHYCLCGGTYRPVMQSLVNGTNSGHYDLIGVQCVRCKRERTFIFDISAFYGKH